MQRLLLITKNYPPAICGVGDHTFFLKRELERLGWQVHILCTTPGASDEAFVVNRFSSNLASEIISICQQHQIKRVIWQYVPYSYQRYGIPWYLPQTFASIKKEGIQQGIFFHEVSVRSHSDGLQNSLIARAQLYLANRINDLAEGFSFTSLPVYQGYFYQTPTLVAISSNIQKQLAFVSSAQHNEPKIIFTFANRVTEPLAKAVGKLQTQQPFLWIIGGRASESQFVEIHKWIRKYRIEQKVALKGLMSNEALGELFTRTYVMAQPEKVNHRGLGGISAKNGTVAAAFCFGVPIITSKGDLTQEALFRENKNCLFVEQRSSSSWQAALKKMIEMPDEEYQQWREQAIEVYEELLSWKVTAEKVHYMLNNSLP